MYVIRYAVCLIAASALLGAGIAQATMHYVFPDAPVATQGFNPTTWVKCKDRKPVKIGKHKYTWYCGPAALVDDDAAGVVGVGTVGVAESATPGRTSARLAGGRSKAQGDR